VLIQPQPQLNSTQPQLNLNLKASLVLIQPEWQASLVLTQA